MLPLLLQGRIQPQLTGKCPDNTVATYPAICLPASTSNSQDPAKTVTGKSKGYLHSSVLAKTSVVLKPSSPLCGNALQPSPEEGSPATELGDPDPSQPPSLNLKARFLMVLKHGANLFG